MVIYAMYGNTMLILVNIDVLWDYDYKGIICIDMDHMNCSAPVVVSAVKPKESRVKKVDFQRGIDMMRPLDTQTVVPGHFNRFYKLPQTSIRWDANVGDCQSSSFGGNALTSKIFETRSFHGSRCHRIPKLEQRSSSSIRMLLGAQKRLQGVPWKG